MDDSTKRRITVILEPEDYDRFDAFCDEKGFKKSTLIARLVREHLDKERFRMQTHLPLRSSDV